MAEERVERRLAAILAADMVGYSRLMEVDEAGTLAALKAHRAQLIDPEFAAHGGRIVKTTGDGLLAEFASVVDAVAGAAAIQRAMAERNKDVPRDSRIEFRIGVNLGDIIIDGDDIYGDGVNIAARLEGLAEPGGICISGAAVDQVEGKLDLAFEDGGEQRVKSIKKPVRVYRVRMATKAVEPALGLPDKPSIAILPFENVSGDPEQEYFADGITEDIITSLSQIRWLFVIARNSTFSYKGKSPDVRQVARELGVRYTLEGSIRKAGNRVRISAQLINATTGNHLWARRYDRELEDIFALQDEIAESIVAAIQPELGSAEQERARRKLPENLNAWDIYQRGLWHMYHFTNEGLDEAQKLFARAIAMDPDFAPSHGGMAYVHVQKAFYAAPETRVETLDEALSMARKAVALDEKDAVGHFTLGRAHSLRCEFEAGVDELETAIDLNPSFAQAHFGLGHVLSHSDRMEKAIPSFDRAIRLSPQDPHLFAFYATRALTHLYLGQYDAAASWARKAVRAPHATFWPHLAYAASLAYLGQADYAKAALAELLKYRPGYTCAVARDDFFFTRNNEIVERAVDGLRKAGLPN
jgi:TolB-like protein/Tfp pilus assembly protein PilF